MSLRSEAQQQQQITQRATEQRNLEGGVSGNQSAPVIAAGSGQQLASQLGRDVGSVAPDYYSFLEQEMPAYTSALANSSNLGLGLTTAGGANIYNAFAPYLNATNNSLGGQNLLSNVGNLSQVANSPQASSLVSGFGNLQSQLNPAYQSTLSGLGSLMSNQNPNALSGSESAQIERGLNQTNFGAGNYGVANPLTNISNALTFGSGLQAKQANFANLANTTANTANTLLGGNTGFGLSTNQTSGSSSPNTSVQPTNFLTNANNTLGLGTQSANAGLTGTGQLTSTLTGGNSAQAGQQASSGSSVNGGICCFVALLGNNIPYYVRPIRDNLYAADPSIQDGYRLMASFLVPLFNVGLICYLTKRFMIDPLVEHGGYIVSERGCRHRGGYYRFWLGVWKMLGKIKRTL